MPVDYITSGADSRVLNPRGGFTGTTLESVNQVGSEVVRKQIARTNAGNIVTDAGIRGSKVNNRLSGETFARIQNELRSGEIDMYL